MDDTTPLARYAEPVFGRAQKTLRHVDWFEVKELRGRIDNGVIVYQATLEIGFALEDANT